MDPVLRTRSLTALFFASAVIALIYSGRYGAMALLVVIILGSAFEFCKIVTGNLKLAWIAVVLNVVLIACITTLPFSSSLMVNIIAIVSLVHLFQITALYTNARGGYEVSMPYYTLLYPGLSISGLLHLIYHQDIYDATLLFSIIVMIWVSDSGAYLVGRKLGKTMLFEKISPKKTWEGTIGAGIFTVMAGVVFYWIRPNFGLTMWLILSIAIWILGSYGDLVESSVKRRYEIKDSGTILPGHGGFFDRFDSFIFVAPFIYLIFHYYKI